MSFDKNRLFISRMFDEISPSYDFLNHLMSGGLDVLWRRNAVKYLKKFDSRLILDLAAGTGDLGRQFLKLKPKNLYSADLSVEMLKKNRKKNDSCTHILIRADAEKLPFDDNFFDICGVAFGIRNFANPESCVNEVKRILKPGGIFYVIEMFKPQGSKIFNRLFNVYFSKIMPAVCNFISRSNYAYNYLQYSVENFLTVDSFINMAQSNGFGLDLKNRNFSNIVYSVCLKKN